MLAVDLSLASLAYAKRKSVELGVANLEYRQGDILALGALEERFDLIECSGVLHHLADPFEGWRVLASLRKPRRPHADRPVQRSRAPAGGAGARADRRRAASGPMPTASAPARAEIRNDPLSSRSSRATRTSTA